MSTESPGSTGTPAGTEPAGTAGQGQQTDPGAGAGAGSEKTFTQEQLNAIVAREKGDIQRRFADYEDLKTKAAEFDKLADAQKTDVQRANDLAATSQRERDDALAAAQTARIESAVIAASARKGIIDPDAATKLLDPAKLQFDGAGKPSNVDQLLDDLIKERPYLVGTASSTTSFDAGARQTAPTGEDMNTRIRRMAGRV